MNGTNNSLKEIENVSIHAWILNNQIKTERGELIDFKSYPYLYDIYKDKSPFICSMKAAQIGFSTFEILASAYEAKNDGIDIIYVLPTADDVKSFSGGKTNRMIDNNPILQSWTEDKDSVEQKRFGKSTIYYRGSWTERTALMISAQKLIVDEFDRCKQEIVEQYDSRLQNAKNPRKAYFSNPTLPDFGIDKYWKISDQKKWHVMHSCGKQLLLDESCINYDKEIFECPVCKQPITDKERKNGEWIKTAQGKWSGYWIPLWINPNKSAKEICEYKRTKTAEYFANFVAGLPYIGSGNKVSASTITQCLSPKVNTQSPRIIIGVDPGVPIYYVCANSEGFFYYGALSDPSTGKDPYQELEAMLKRWDKSIIISDGQGEYSGMRLLRDKYPGRVFLSFYRKDRKSMDIVDWGEGEEYGKVIVDRNRAIQQFIDELSDKRHIFNGTESEWHDYITHWLNIHREWEVDDAGLINKERGYVWSRTGPDHWVHASLYARIGLDKFSKQMAKIVGYDSFDGIPYGRTY